MSERRRYLLGVQISSIVVGALTLLTIAISKFISNRAILVVVGVALVTFVASLVLLARAAADSRSRIAGRVALSLLGALALGYVVLFGVIYFGQDVIADHTNAFFQPQPLTQVAAARVDAPNVERVEIRTADGVALRGWLVHGSAEAKQPLAIYFGGSGSESSKVLAHARLLAPWSVALVNYRGFGQSTGAPTPGNAHADGLLIYDTLVKREDVDAGHVAVIGYSLGTGIAVHLAEQREVVGVVLFAPYESLKLVNPGMSPLYEPLQPMMKLYFTSIDRVPQIKAPLLILVGSQDRVFPPEGSRRLAAQWGGPSEVKIYEGAGHTLSEENDASWRDVAAFLAKQSAAAQ